MPVCQKLGVHLESKVVQKLSLEKKITKKWSPLSMSNLGQKSCFLGTPIHSFHDRSDITLERRRFEVV